jgi:hypothetical protein
MAVSTKYINYMHGGTAVSREGILDVPVPLDLIFRNEDKDVEVPAPDKDYVDSFVSGIVQALKEAGVELVEPPIQETKPGRKFDPSQDVRRNVPVYGMSVTFITLKMPPADDLRAAKVIRNLDHLRI